MTSKTDSLSAMGEFGLLRQLLPRLHWPSSLRNRLVIPPGDDAGAFRVRPGHVVVFSTDAFVEKMHFDRAWFSWEDVGYKSLAVNLSDLAAMGAVRPLAAVITTSFPKNVSLKNVQQFARGLNDCAKRWKIGLLGGDTVGSKGLATISIAVTGEAKPSELIRRSGARPGDWVMATGFLGCAAAGLDILRSRRPVAPWMKPLVQAFRRPVPRFDVSTIIARRGWATSLLDCSDGLETSARLISENSGVRIDLLAPHVTVHPALRRWTKASSRSLESYLLSGGEEYELVFTINPMHFTALIKKCPDLACIGTVSKGRGAFWMQNGKPRPLTRYGFSHF